MSWKNKYRNDTTKLDSEFIAHITSRESFKCDCKNKDDRRVCEMIDRWIEQNGDFKKEWLVKRLSPSMTNMGYCYELAEDIVSGLHDKSARVVEIQDGKEVRQGFDHWAINYKGKYYDAEIPCGVRKFKDIPFVKYLRNREFHEIKDKEEYERNKRQR
jgi:hypothetical protein